MASSSALSPDHAVFPTVSINGAMIPVAECTDMEALEEQVRLIEDRASDLINRLKRESSVYKVQRNSLLPVSRIPEEVLIRIFRSISNEEKPFKRTEIWWDWLVLTKVCKRWRDAALRCSVLWAELRNFSKIDKIRAFLERSGQADLLIDLPALKENASQIIESLTPHMWRVRALKVSFRDRDVSLKSLQDRLRDLTARNKTLSISSEGGPQQNGFQGLLIDSSFTSIHPENIRLKGINACWSSAIFHGLSDLHLEDICEQFKPELSEILDILEHCTGLQNLTLINAGPRPNNLESKIIHLPQLQSISLRKIDIDAATQTIEHITFSLNTRCSLSFSSYAMHQVEELLPKILLGRRNCHNINIHLEDDRISVYASYKDDWLHSTVCFGFERPLDDIQGFQLALEAIQSALEHPFFSNVLNVTIDFIGNGIMKIIQMDRNTWNRLYQTLPESTDHLSIILPRKIKHFMAKGLTGALSDTIDEDTETILALPNLTTIMIYYADFSTDDGVEAYDILMEYIERRNRISGFECDVGFEACEGIEEDEVLKNIRLEWEAEYGSDDE